MTAESTTGTSDEFPRPGSMFYNMLIAEKSKKTYLKMFRIFNNLVTPLYKIRLLPLLGLGRRLLILTTIGRKSGKVRNNPVEYFRIDGSIHIFSGYGKKADWFRNMMANPDKFFVQAGFRKFPAKPIVLDENEVEEVFKWLSINHPKYMKTGFGWDKDKDTLETTDFSSLNALLRVIRIEKRG